MRVLAYLVGMVACTLAGIATLRGTSNLRGTASAQEPQQALQPNQVQAGRQPGVYAPSTRAHASSVNWGQSLPQPPTKEEAEEQQKLVELLGKFRGSGSQEDKATARKGLEELLSAQLDRDLAKREEKLVEIEKRAAELRTQLEARRKNKEQTLEILMMLAENPSAGLGIPPQWMQSFGIDNQDRNPYRLGPGSASFGPVPLGSDPFGVSEPNTGPFGNPPPSGNANPFGDSR